MPAATGELKPYRVLIVEDDPVDAEIVVDELTTDGLDFVFVRVDDEASMRGALDAFGPDVIVADLSMPGFSGHRALELVRSLPLPPPFIFFSGTIGEDAAIDALRGGATDYVLKHQPARLASSVRRALAEAAERLARNHAEAELIRAQRFESLGMLASGLSHDLRNVLQPLLLTADMIADHDDPQVRRFGALAGDCARRGLEMVASMLSFARGTRNDREAVRVSTLFDALRPLLQPSVPARIVLDIGHPDDDIVVAANVTELQQALLNLSLNALQAMPGNGLLAIGASVEALDAAFFREGESARPGMFARIDIRDTGTGMSGETLQRLFTPFFTTKDDGTGLGLVSCLRIVEHHRGVVRVDSVEGKGTTFSLFLPRHEASGEVQVENIADIPRGNGERLLLVIESATQLSLVCDALALHGYQPAGASDGMQALRKLDEYGVPRLVLMEADMNLATGVRTLSALLDRDYAGPLVLMAKPDSPPSFDDLPPSLPIHVIHTPVIVPELLRAVHDALHPPADA